MTAYTELVHPLGIMPDAGLDTLRRLGLNTEASMADDIDDMREFSDVLVSAHAPSMIGNARLNIGATDAEFRKTSIAVIVEYIDHARRYPNVEKINMHFAPKRWSDPAQTTGREGVYDLMVEGIREIGAFCQEYELELVLENSNSYWTDDIKGIPYDQVDWSQRNEYFGMSPENWRETVLDVDMDNVGLCLDSSHVVTYAHRFSEDRREERVMAFLERPELIRHVHWNDNYLYDYRGRTDSHAALDHGSLPTEMHRRIKYLDATLLMEHFHGLSVLQEELAFIDNL